jgi:hypothetical protein
VLTSDDLEFQEYLKQFRPLAPESLQTVTHRRNSPRRVVFILWAAAAAVLISVVIMMWPRPKPISLVERTGSLAGLEQITNSQPLTLGSVNVLLANAPSVEAAVDLVAFQPRTTQLPKGKQSALALLSKENTKP